MVQRQRFFARTARRMLIGHRLSLCDAWRTGKRGNSRLGFFGIRLVDKFDLDLSLLARLGGHSQPRTHRGKERFPGMTITYALIQMLEKAHHTTRHSGPQMRRVV